MKTWFNWLTSRRRPHGIGPRRSGTVRLTLEALEDRRVPSGMGGCHAGGMSSAAPAVTGPTSLLGDELLGRHIGPDLTTVGPTGEFRAVAAAAATDAWAVGDAATGGTLAQHFDGTQWTVVPTPNPGTTSLLNGVIDLSPTNAWTVGQALIGSFYISLIEQWNGASWSVVSSPNLAGGDNVLNAVTAVGPNDIWAAGWHRDTNLIIQPLAEHWDGQNWSIVTTPRLPSSPTLFFGISAAATNDVWAVGRTGGHAATLIEHWDGTRWSIISSPTANLSALYAATVVSANDVWTVGQAGSRTLTEHWNGQVWSIVPSPNGTSNSNNFLSGVAAVSTNQVFAVGNFGNGLKTLLERWDGQRWSIVSSPNPGNLSNTLAAVAALSTGQLFTVGSFSNTDGTHHSFIFQP